MSNSRVQLSFILNKADWIPEAVRAKMRVIHKNRISKSGEFSVACQIHSSQSENYKAAIEIIERHFEEAEAAVAADEFEARKMDNKAWIIEKMKRDGREKELEKREEAIKRLKSASRERTRNKKMDW